MRDDKFEKEYRLVEDALEDEKGEIQLRSYLAPLVNSVVSDYLSANEGMEKYKEHLVSAGWAHLSFALKKYKEHAEAMEDGVKEEFTFSAYYTWYIRQGILEYIRSIGEGDKTNTLL